MTTDLQALVAQWREEAESYTAQAHYAPGLGALAMGHKECASELEAALAAADERRAELERKSRAHATAIDDEMRQAGFAPDAPEDDLDPHVSQEIWDAVLGETEALPAPEEE